MEQKFYILTTLVKYSDELSTGHALYCKLDNAEKAMKQEIEEISLNFNMDDMDLTTDFPRYKEYLDKDGSQGFVVSIEEVIPQ